MPPHRSGVIVVALWLLLACTAPAVGAANAAGTARPPSGSTQQQRGMLMRWFNKMDADRDGELQAGEIREFIGAQLDTAGSYTGRQLDHAIEQVTDKLDGADVGLDVSVSELDQHLHRVLAGVKVWEWVAHSLGLPMYAEAFRGNSIVVHDFPMLVNDGGQLLQAELMVTSLLHRQKLMRAMQRQMLGLGAEPGPIQHLNCSSSSSSSSKVAGVQLPSATSRSMVQCTWRSPSMPGEPPLHKYVLERFALAPPSPAAAWQPVAELDDLVMTRFSDAVADPGSYQYRVAAWNLYGRSAYAVSEEVVTGELSGGSNASGDTAAAATGTVQNISGVPAATPAVAASDQQQTSRHQHQQQQQVALEQQQQCVQQQVLQTQKVICQAGERERLSHQMFDAAPLIQGSVASSGQHAVEPRQQQLQQQEQQLLSLPPAYLALLGCNYSQQHGKQQEHQLAAVSGHRQLQDVAYAVVPMSRHQQQLQPQEQHHGNQQQQQQQQRGADTLPDGLVRQMGVCNSCSSAIQNGFSSLCTPGDSTVPPTDGIGCAAGQHISNALGASSTGVAGGAAAAAGTLHMPAGADAVWVVAGSSLAGNRASSSPAVIAAHAQLLASMQAAAGAAAGVGSQPGHASSSSSSSSLGKPTHAAGKAAAAAAGSWSLAAFIASHVGRWLRALLNSLLLLVVPVCVRLLPVPVLHQLALGLAQLLQLLPQPVRRMLQQLGATRSSTAEQVLEAGTVAGDQTISLVGIAPGSQSFNDLNNRSGSNRISSSISSRIRSSSSSTGGAAAAAAADAECIPSLPAAALEAAPMGLPLHVAAAPGAQQAGARQLSAAGGPQATTAAGGVVVKKTSAQPGLLFRSVTSSPEGSVTAPPAAASPVPANGPAAAGALAAAAGPYTGMYGFAWQGPAAPAAAAPGQQADVQAVHAALAPDAGSPQQQQQQLVQLQHVKSQSQRAAAAGAAAEGSCRGGQCLYASLEQQLLPSSGLPNKKRCAFPGCTQQFDLRHLRALKTRHYCGRCQQGYCLAHTAYSPHGPSGGCGAESRCVCSNCFADFTPEYQVLLATRNTIQPGGSSGRSKSGPPQQGDGSCSDSGRGASGGGSSSGHGSPVLPAAAAAAAAAVAGTVSRDLVLTKSSPALHQQQVRLPSSKLWMSRSSNTLCTLTRDQPADDAADTHPEPAVACSRNRSSSSTGVQDGRAACTPSRAQHQHVKGRMLWARAWTKSKAVVWLLQAGQQHNSTLASQEPQHSTGSAGAGR